MFKLKFSNVLKTNSLQLTTLNVIYEKKKNIFEMITCNRVVCVQEGHKIALQHQMSVVQIY